MAPKSILQGKQQVLGLFALAWPVWIAGSTHHAFGSTHHAFGLSFAFKISWIHGMGKVGKALQDHQAALDPALPGP